MTDLSAGPLPAALRWLALLAAIALPPGLTVLGLAALVVVVARFEHGRAGVLIAVGMAACAYAGTVVVYAGL